MLQNFRNENENFLDKFLGYAEISCECAWNDKAAQLDNKKDQETDQKECQLLNRFELKSKT